MVILETFVVILETVGMAFMDLNNFWYQWDVPVWL